MKRIFNKKGFTLVELLIVIAVLGIIAGIGVTTMGGVTKTFKEKADVETARQVARQIEVQILAGNLTVGTGLDNDDIKAKVTSYPEPQSGDAFTFAVAADGTVTASVDGTALTADPKIKVATAAIE